MLSVKRVSDDEGSADGDDDEDQGDGVGRIDDNDDEEEDEDEDEDDACARRPAAGERSPVVVGGEALSSRTWGLAPRCSNTAGRCASVRKLE